MRKFIFSQEHVHTFHLHKLLKCEQKSKFFNQHFTFSFVVYILSTWSSKKKIKNLFSDDDDSESIESCKIDHQKHKHTHFMSMRVIISSISLDMKMMIMMMRMILSSFRNINFHKESEKCKYYIYIMWMRKRKKLYVYKRHIYFCANISWYEWEKKFIFTDNVNEVDKKKLETLWERRSLFLSFLLSNVIMQLKRILFHEEEEEEKKRGNIFGHLMCAAKIYFFQGLQTYHVSA